MKKIILLLVLTFWAGSGFAAELLVFAGSGMRAPLQELGEEFTRETGIEVAFDFDGSGRLGSKILMGVKPDFFVPGGETWGLKLQQEGYVDQCVTVAYHTPVIITPKGSLKVKSLNDLRRQDVKLALGDSKAAAIGRSTQALFDRAGLNPAEMNVVARAISVKQLVSWVETGSVDAAIVWRADAFQSQLVETVAIPEQLNSIENIPLCSMANPGHPDEAAQLWQFLLSRGAVVFAKHGFKVVER